MRQPVELRPLSPANAGELRMATELLAAALPLDQAAVVAPEKLFSSNGRRRGYTVGAFSPGGGELLGLLAQAGRFIKLLAVAPAARRRGVGTALLAAARTRLHTETVAATPAQAPAKLRVCDHAGNYLSPGLDERYTEGRAFLRARGFDEVAHYQNLRAPLKDSALRLDALSEKVHASGYTVRRASAADAAPLSAMVAQAFSPIWALEVERALGPALGGDSAAHTPELREGAAVHVALDEQSAVVAFAAHDGNNRGLGWFGPTGTLPPHRGRSLGELLLLLCLRDVAEAARPEGGVIAWVGPAEFYARACGAIVDRRFVVYEGS
jgi:GNAT superfamily N-acetyltransferase